MGVRHTHRNDCQASNISQTRERAQWPPRWFYCAPSWVQLSQSRWPKEDLRLTRAFEEEVKTESFSFGPVRIKTVPFFTTIKIITGLLMSIALIQFLYSSVRIRNQEKSEMKKCEKTCEINPKIYTICPKGRT